MDHLLSKEMKVKVSRNTYLITQKLLFSFGRISSVLDENILQKLVKDGFSMKKIMTFFSTNVGSFVLTFGVIFVLFSLKEQFGVQDTIITTMIVAAIAIIISEMTRKFCEKALLDEEEVKKRAVVNKIEENKKNNYKAK
jgi:hypothetical protein